MECVLLLSYTHKQHVLTPRICIVYGFITVYRLDAAPQEDQLFEAIDSDDVEWLKRILTGNPSGCEIADKVGYYHYKTPYIILPFSIQYGCTLLHRAAGRGRMECLRYIVEKDGNSISKEDKVSKFVITICSSP